MSSSTERATTPLQNKFGVMNLVSGEMTSVDGIESFTFSPDGAFVAVNVINGSTKPKASPFFNDFGLLKIYRISGTEFTPVTEARIGHWCQGVAWSKDSKNVLVQCMVENEITTFAFDGKTLTRTAPIAMKVSPAGIRTAEP